MNMNSMTNFKKKENHLSLKFIDDDFDIPLKKPSAKAIEDKEKAVSSIMEGAKWLWRHANIRDLHDQNTPKKESEREKYVIEDKKKKNDGNRITDGYKCTIVLPSAYCRNGDEDSLSLFQVVENLRCNEIKNLQYEADVFFLFLPREQRDISINDRPIALIREILLQRILPHDIEDVLPLGIEKTPPKNKDKTEDGNTESKCSDIKTEEGTKEIETSDKRTEFLACHWDIHLTDRNLSPTNLNLLYNILASSSMAFRNNNPNGKLGTKIRLAN